MALIRRIIVISFMFVRRIMSSSLSSPKAAAMTTATCGRSSKYKCLRSYPLLPNHNNNHSNSNKNAPSSILRLTVAQGSVVDFRHPYGAIVNAANEGCLGGGGVDGAISNAGGLQLALDREALPIVQGRYTRCPTGHAKLTGPAARNRRDDDTTTTNNNIATYGDLGVPYVIHAVGPNYMQFDEDNDVGTPNRLLRSAYKKSLDCCKRTHRPKTDESNNQNGKDKEQPPPIRAVGFSLLSAGIFRGDQTLTDVLGIGVKALRDWARDQSNEDANPQHDQLEEIVLFAFTDREAKTLLRVCDWVLLGKKPEKKSGSSSAKKMDPPGQKVETNKNAEVNLVAKNENDSTTAETGTTAADETKDAAPVDANEPSKKSPADPEAGPPSEDKVMTDVEDNGSSGAEDSPVKSDLVAEANTVEDAPEEEKVMTDTEEEATIVAKTESPLGTKRTVETLKTTATSASEDKVMTDVESLESCQEFLESEASNKEETTTTCTAGDQKTMDTATTEKKDPN